MIERVEEPEDFQRALYEPPLGMPLTERVIQQEADAFDAFASAFGVKKPKPATIPSDEEVSDG